MKPLLVYLLLLGLPLTAAAQYVEEPDAPTTPEARAARAAVLKQKSGEALTAGNQELALQRIEAAIRLSDDPDLIANKAFILQKLGQYKEAVAAFQNYLELAPGGGSKAEMARQFLARLMPQVTFNSTPPGVTVTRQGEKAPMGTTPFRAKVVAGTVLFIMTIDGYKPLRHLAKIVPDTPLTVDVELERKAAPKPVSKVPKEVVEAPKSIAAKFDDDDGGTGLAWISLGTAAVAAGAAGLFYGGGVEAAEARDASTKAVDWDAHQSTLEGKNLLYLSSGSVAVAAGLLGAYLLFTAPSDKPETLSATPGTATFSVEF